MTLKSEIFSVYLGHARAHDNKYIGPKWHTRAFPRSTLFLRNEATPNKILCYTRLYLKNTSTKLQLQQIKLHIEIVNLKRVTPTTILLRSRGQGAKGAAAV